MMLVVMYEVGKSILKPSDVVHCFYQLIKAIVIRLVPELLLAGLKEQINEGSPDAFLENAGEIVLYQGNMLREVLVDLHDVFQLSINVAHQKVDVEIVLTSQKLSEFLWGPLFECEREFLQLFQSLLMIGARVFPVLSDSWGLALPCVAANDSTKWLNFGTFEEISFLGDRDDFVIFLTPALASDFETMLIFEDDQAYLPKLIAIFKVYILTQFRPILQ